MLLLTVNVEMYKTASLEEFLSSESEDQQRRCFALQLLL